MNKAVVSDNNTAFYFVRVTAKTIQNPAKPAKTRQNPPQPSRLDNPAFCFAFIALCYY